jgi:AraC-like DNA-binding protein
MQMTSFAPSPALEPIVERFSIVESIDEVTRALLPNLAPIMGVRFAGAASVLDDGRATRMPDATLTGVQGAVRHMRTHPGGGVVLAHFRPGGAAACFRLPVNELFGASVPLDALLDRAEVSRLSERISTAGTHPARVAILDAFLRARMTEIDPIAVAAARAIVAAHGSLRIADLATTLRITQDPLEKRFRRAIGTSPKHFASLARVLYAIELGKGGGGSWTRVALEAGYFDQPHFNREFRAVTGEAPVTFFRTTSYC